MIQRHIWTKGWNQVNCICWWSKHANNGRIWSSASHWNLKIVLRSRRMVWFRKSWPHIQKIHWCPSHHCNGTSWRWKVIHYSKNVKTS